MQGPGLRSLVSYYTSRVPQLRPQLSKIKKKKKKLKTSKTQTANIKASIQRNKWTGSQIRQKSNSFLSSTGYPTQRQNKLAYSREKAPERKHTFQLYTLEWLTLLCWARRLPNADPLFQLPCSGASSAALGNSEGQILKISGPSSC